MASALVSASGFCLQVLALSYCPDFSWWATSVSWNKPLPHQVSFGYDFYHSSKKQIRIIMIFMTATESKLGPPVMGVQRPSCTAQAKTIFKSHSGNRFPLWELLACEVWDPHTLQTTASVHTPEHNCKTQNTDIKQVLTGLSCLLASFHAAGRSHAQKWRRKGTIRGKE